MNERIRELARRVVGKRRDDAGPIWLVDEQIEKLAQLIVRECIEINRQRFFPDYEGNLLKVSHNNALWCAISDMKEHFGVME